MPFDLAGVLGAISDSIGNNNASAGQIKGVYGAAQGAGNAEAKAAVDGINAQKTIDLQKDQGELQAQQDSIKAATALGTNMSDPSQIVSFLGAQMKQAALAQTQAASQVQDLESNNDLFLNPLGWLRDFTYGDQARSKLAGANATLKASSDGLQALNIATQQTTKTQEVIAQTKSAATVQAQQEVDSAKAAQVLAESRKNNALLNVRMINDLSSLDSKNTALVMQGYNATVQDQSRQLVAAQKELYIEAAQDKKKTAQEQADAEAQQTGFMNQAESYYGLPLSKSAKVSASISSQGKARTDTLINLGQQISAAKESGTDFIPPVFGKDFEEAYQNMAKLGIPVPPAMNKLYGDLRQAGAAASDPTVLQQALITTGIAEGKSPQQIQQDAKSKATMMMATPKGQQQAQVIVAHAKLQGGFIDQPFMSTESNPYSPGPLTSLNWTGLTDNKFLDTYLAPKIKAANDAKQPLAFDPGDLLLAATGAAYGPDKGKISTTEIADGISGLAQQLVMQNNLTKNFNSFALPPQHSLKVSIMLAGSNVPHTYDLTNPTDIQKYLAATRPTIIPKLLKAYSDVLFGGKGQTRPMLP